MRQESPKLALRKIPRHAAEMQHLGHHEEHHKTAIRIERYQTLRRGSDDRVRRDFLGRRGGSGGGSHGFWQLLAETHAEVTEEKHAIIARRSSVALPPRR